MPPAVLLPGVFFCFCFVRSYCIFFSWSLILLICLISATNLFPVTGIVIVFGQRTINHLRFRVEASPLALVNRDIFPGIGAGMKLMHGPSGRHRISGDRSELAEYRRIIVKDVSVVFVRASGGHGVITVRNEHIVAEPCIEYAHGVL